MQSMGFLFLQSQVHALRSAWVFLTPAPLKRKDPWNAVHGLSIFTVPSPRIAQCVNL
jgi:hypothetical protein